MKKQKWQIVGVCLTWLLVSLAMSTAADGARLGETDTTGRTVVIWISIDGVRPDYIERSETPVKDWVMSYGEFNGTTAAHHASGYDGRLTDRERIQIVLDTWRDDEAAEPVQLLMGYMDHPDKTGHLHGPDGPEIEFSMKKMDEHMSTFVEEALTLFRERMEPEDALYLLVTSDHGMSTVHTAVNPYALTGISREESDGEP